MQSGEQPAQLVVLGADAGSGLSVEGHGGIAEPAEGRLGGRRELTRPRSMMSRRSQYGHLVHEMAGHQHRAPFGE